VQELANDFNKGRDSYPDSLTEAYELMLHDVRDQDARQPSHENPGMAFNTVGGGETSVSGTDTQLNPRPDDVTCHKCGKLGHFSNKCAEVTHASGATLCTVAEESGEEDGGEDIPADQPPTEDADDDANEDAVDGGDGVDVNVAILGSEDVDDDSVKGFSFLNDGGIAKSFEQHKASIGQGMPKSWILLDNQSTVDVFCSKSLLKNIREAPNICKISCNAGVVNVKMIGDLRGYPAPVWYHPGGIANILSLHWVSQYCRVQYDSKEDQAAFQVTKTDGSIRNFKPSVAGLHYCDTKKNETLLVNTVADKKSKYTVRGYKQAILSQCIQDIIGRPSTRDFLKIVEGGMLRNCPVSRADIKAAEDMLGPNIGSQKGKTVRRKGAHVPSLVMDVPYHIIRTHRDVTLCFDIMFVNKISFLVTVSRNIRFGTTERILSRNADVVGKALVRVIAFYRQRGFRVKECNGEGEFGPLRGDIAEAQAQLNTTAEDEHVPEVERYIRTIKERTRAVYNTSPFKKMPGMMIVEVVHASNY
jgi:hypothetical protein